MLPTIAVQARQLWGNEAADDEDPEILNSYFVTQPQWGEFFDAKVALSIARARKGMGKSALLRECAFRAQHEDASLVIPIKGSDLVAQKEFKNQTPIEQIYDWQQRVCTIVSRYIGANIGLAFTDDKITLVESAELAGWKARNIVGLLIDRLKGKIGRVELTKMPVKDSSAILSRFFAGDEEALVWLLIDDIDATFGGTPAEVMRLSTFFSACRDLAANYRGLIIRVVVRTDVWALIRKLDEALDKAEQYIFDISWSQKQFRQFLVERISSYVKRTCGQEVLNGMSDDQLLNAVFDSKFRWGDTHVSPHRVIHTYAAGRPRWATQLCRMAGTEAVKVGAQKIKMGHISQVLDAYGGYRVDDVAREYRQQCERIAEIVNAFAKREAIFGTEDLLRFIDERVIGNLRVEIDGHLADDPMEIARLLFRAGFLLGLDEKDKKDKRVVEYYQFEEKPDLLKSHANLDDGMKWFIHPSFHRVLSLRADL
jgi:hypothetical protein